MKKHIKIYMQYFNYGEQDYIPCEICGARCNDVHHISARGMGGSKEKDFIENLMGLCRADHDRAENQTFSEFYLNTIHLRFIQYYQETGYNWWEKPEEAKQYLYYPLPKNQSF